MNKLRRDTKSYDILFQELLDILSTTEDARKNLLLICTIKMSICGNVYIGGAPVVVPKVEKIKKLRIPQTKAERKAKEREYIDGKKNDVNVTKHGKERTIERTQLNVEKLGRHIVMGLLHKKNRLEYCKAKGTYRLTCKRTNTMYILSGSLDVITVLNYKEYKEGPRTADKYYKVINRSIRHERLKDLGINVNKIKTILGIGYKRKEVIL